MAWGNERRTLRVSRQSERQSRGSGSQKTVGIPASQALIVPKNERAPIHRPLKRAPETTRSEFGSTLSGIPVQSQHVSTGKDQRC